MAEKQFVYVPSENRYILQDLPVVTNTPMKHRVFEQAAVLHTSEDVPFRLTRAYNLEDEIAINDSQLKKGAQDRGQKLGDVSGGQHLKDSQPENL
jgi:hypothetical protein